MKKNRFKQWSLLVGAVLAANVTLHAVAEEEKPTEKQTAMDAVFASEQELVRRQESVITTKQKILEAQRLLSNGEYAKAVGLFEEAEKRLVNAPASAEEEEQIRQGKSLCFYKLAQDAFKQKDYNQAMANAESAYNLDPANQDAASIYQKASFEAGKLQKKKDANAKALQSLGPEINNEGFIEKQRQVLDLYRSAENYLKSEQFDSAEKCLKKILLIDPYSATAYHRLREVQLAKMRKLTPAKQQAEIESMLDVQNGWRLPIRRDIRPPDVPDTQGSDVDTGSKRKINDKLAKLIIKKIEFVNCPLKDAINQLIEYSREEDKPSREGVNILLEQPHGTTAAAPVAAPAPAMEAAPVAPGGEAPAATPAPAAPTTPIEPTATGMAAIPVSLNLVNAPLGQAIKFLTMTTGLKYRIEKDAVVIVSGESVTGTQTRIFNVNPGVFRAAIERADAGGGGGGGGGGGFVGMGVKEAKSKAADVKKIFEEFGITFPQGTSISYQDSLGLLVATHRNEVLDQIEEIMLRMNKVTPQVQIEAKFIEVRQSDLEQLGFRWAFAPTTQRQYTVESGAGTALPGIPIGGPYRGLGNPLTGGLRNSLASSALDALLGGAAAANPTILTITGVLTNPQFQVFIDALSQKGLTNLLSAPRVTTTSGEQARILVTREFIYPSAFTDPQVQTGTSSSTGGTGSVGITAPSPSAFSTREVGVILDVRPQVGPDNYTINLTLSPEVVDFEGFIYYNTYAVANGTQFTFTLPQPLFSKRSLSTSVTIWDDNIVVLGGLIREDTSKINDKVPFLGDMPFFGRFFQSKMDTTTKRNLMIFLAARIVDPSGKPIRTHEQPLASNKETNDILVGE
jgi:general secretion pathway protein D